MHRRGRRQRTGVTGSSGFHGVARFVVVGRGAPEALGSRLTWRRTVMSPKQALQSFDWEKVHRLLRSGAFT